MAGRRRHRQERHHLATEHSDRGGLHHATRPTRAGPRRQHQPLSYQGTLIDDIAVRFEEDASSKRRPRAARRWLNKVLTPTKVRASSREVRWVAFLADLERRAAVL